MTNIESKECFGGAKQKGNSEFSMRNEKKISLGADSLDNSQFRRRLGIF